MSDEIYVSPMPGQAMRTVTNWHSGYNEYTRELVEHNIEAAHIITSEVRKHIRDKPGEIEYLKKKAQEGPWDDIWLARKEFYLSENYLNMAWYPGTHKPVLDIDFEAELILDSHNRKFLILHKKVSVSGYKELIKALAEVGIIGPAYHGWVGRVGFFLDCEAKLIPSSTEGHFHLFIDKEMSWNDYKDLMRVLAVVGILEEGYVRASEAREYSAVRLPWVKKGRPLTEKLLQELGDQDVLDDAQDGEESPF